MMDASFLTFIANCLFFSCLFSADIRRKRSGIRKETETAEVIKTAAETTVITPAARKREVKTKTEKEIRRGS